MSWNFNNFGSTDAQTMANLFNYCTSEYNATLEGCQEICRVAEAKERLFDERFKNIPGYVPGEHCIVLDAEYLRNTDPETIWEFFSEFDMDCREAATLNGKTRDEWWQLYDRLSTAVSYVDRIKNMAPLVIDFHKAKGIAEEMRVANKNYHNCPHYTESSVERYNKRKQFKSLMRDYTDQYLNDGIVGRVNEIYPELKAAEKAKTSKLVRKWCKVEGFENEYEFERKYARYSNAINPLSTPEWLVISWNKFDYLTMSFGNTWTSCHSIDKYNIHEYTGRAADYRGCFSSGPLSYMGDLSSLVVYMIHKDSPKPYWNIPKIRRQMFHISSTGQTMVQGRLYPDDQSDCGHNADFSAYKQWREILQDVISRAFDFPNLWKVKKGTGECGEHTSSYGTHYKDYVSYGNCNVSIHGDVNEVISIGHDPICPSCGNTHDESEWCTCYDCRSGGRRKVYCADCGGELDPEGEYTYYIDGEYYCENCVSYCEYHEEYEHNVDMINVYGYGYVCDDALDRMVADEDAFYCECCGEYFAYHLDCPAEDVNGDVHHFCSVEHRDRYMENNSELFTHNDDDEEVE